MAVLEKLEEAFYSNDKLLQVVEGARSIKQLQKSATYRAFLKKVRKEVYYSLRTYYSDDTSLTQLVGEYRQLVAEVLNQSND